MVSVTLERFNVKKINYINEFKKTEENIELLSSVSTNVNYNKEQHKCVCTQALKITPSDDQGEFCVEIELVGLFSYEEGNKNDIHIEVANQLYPHLQKTIASVMTIIGIPDFVLPALNIKPEDVKS